MSLIDLTCPADYLGWSKTPASELSTRDVPLHSDACRYTGVVHEWKSSSMCGSYIDFPGHIRETDDGLDAATYPAEKLYRQRGRVLHLDRASGSGAVTPADLLAASGGVAPRDIDVLLINALGSRLPQQIAMRSVWLTLDAVEWIAETGCHILVSDIFESTALDGVFLKLFAKGIGTVCEPHNLWRLPNEALITILFPAVPGMKQTPCRVLAEC